MELLTSVPSEKAKILIAALAPNEIDIEFRKSHVQEIEALIDKFNAAEKRLLLSAPSEED